MYAVQWCLWPVWEVIIVMKLLVSLQEKSKKSKNESAISIISIWFLTVKYYLFRRTFWKFEGHTVQLITYSE